MAADRDRSRQAMRAKLAAASPAASKIKGFLCHCRGRRVACGYAPDTGATTVRPSLDWFASTGRYSSKKNSQRIRRPTSRSTEERFDDGRAGGRLYAG